jgi:hypothetical protein
LHHSATQTGSCDISDTSSFSSGVSVCTLSARLWPGHAFFTKASEASARPSSLSATDSAHLRRRRILTSPCAVCVLGYYVQYGIRNADDGPLFLPGPPKYSELRINFSQAFNGIGTVIAPVLGSYVIFVDIGDDEAALRNVQWIYLAIACFCVLLALAFLL